jgi:hypothetical protein
MGAVATLMYENSVLNTVMLLKVFLLCCSSLPNLKACVTFRCLTCSGNTSHSSGPYFKIVSLTFLALKLQVYNTEHSGFEVGYLLKAEEAASSKISASCFPALLSEFSKP